MIFKITYLSNRLKVMGYLGFPNYVNITLQDVKKFHGVLAVEEVSQSIVPKRLKLVELQMPAFIYCRGGIGRIGKVKPSWVEAFTNQGYLVFAPCYRGHEGGEGRDEFGGADEEDVHFAYHLIKSFPFVDSEKISIMGFSRGSINATKTAITVPNIHKLVLWGGVSNLQQTYVERVDLRRMLKRVIGGSPNKCTLAYQERSPIRYAQTIRCPVLIVHGTADLQVHVNHGLNMYKELKSLSKNTTLHLYEGYGHHFPFPIHNLAIKKMFVWIEENN